MTEEQQGLVNVTFPSYVGQMYITTNPKVHFFIRDTQIEDQRIYGATIAGMILISIGLELVSFLKWFIVTRKRITSNSLESLVQINKTAHQQKSDEQKFKLNPFERVLAILMNIIQKGTSFLLVVLVIQTYNLGYLLTIVIARSMGNLIFGLVQDSIVIKKIRRERKEIEENKEKQLQMAELNLQRKGSQESYKF